MLNLTVQIRIWKDSHFASLFLLHFFARHSDLNFLFSKLDLDLQEILFIWFSALFFCIGYKCVFQNMIFFHNDDHPYPTHAYNPRKLLLTKTKRIDKKKQRTFIEGVFPFQVDAKVWNIPSYISNSNWNDGIVGNSLNEKKLYTIF